MRTKKFKKFKPCIAFAMAVLLFFASFGIAGGRQEALAADKTEVYWAVKDGTLYLSGSKKDDSYYESDEEKRGWSSESNDVTSVVIQDDIKPNTTKYWFYGFKEMERISGLDKLNTKKLINTEYMFSGCENLSEVIFEKNEDVFDMTNVESMIYMFAGCKKLEKMDLSNIKTSDKLKNTQNMFHNCQNLEKVVFGENFNTSGVTKMSSMFQECTKLSDPGIKGLNTSSVIYMNLMFYKCENLKKLDMSGSDISKVENMDGMFADCAGLTEVYFNENSSSEEFASKTMRSMFNGCSNLNKLDISGLKKSKDMYAMFYNCSELETLEFGEDFSTESVENMWWMFGECKKLNNLDLRGFNTDKVKIMSCMFYNCSNLKSIYVKSDTNWNTAQIEDGGEYMFSGCDELSGGMGTKFDDDHVDILYACADSESQKGYFTDFITVGFDADGGTPQPETQSIPRGTNVEKPATDPQKSGRVFKGWYAPNSEVPYDFITAIAQSITLIAGYKIPVNSISLIMDEPVCGKIVGKNEDGAGNIHQDPEPTVILPDNAAYMIHENFLNKHGCGIWEKPNGEIFFGTMAGGDEYCLHTQLAPASEYCFTDDVKVYVNGKELDPKEYSLDANGILRVEHVFTAEHPYGEWKEKEAPTCTKNGVEERVCAHDDSHTETRKTNINKDAHDWDEGKITTEPTCTEKGVKTFACNNDPSHTRQEEVNALGHDYGEWVEIKAPTYDEEGLEKRVCKHNSSHWEIRPIEKLDPAPAQIIYTVVYGGGSAWEQGSGKPNSFTFKRSEEDNTAFEHFEGIRVDGNDVPEKDNVGNANWTAASGSVIIELQPSYLESLALGEHTLTALFDDGSATAEFTILAKEEDPTQAPTEEDPTQAPTEEDPTQAPTEEEQPTSEDKKTEPATKPESEEKKPEGKDKSADTGDTGSILIWAIIIPVAVAGITATVIFSRKRRNM